MSSQRRSSRPNAHARCLNGPAVLLTAALLSAPNLIGCGGAALRDGVYDDGRARYRIGTLAPEWRGVEVGDNDLAFFRRGMGTISLNSTCSDYDDVPAVGRFEQTGDVQQRRLARTRRANERHRLSG